jgi:peptide/nickel transport system permease protein
MNKSVALPAPPAALIVAPAGASTARRALALLRQYPSLAAGALLLGLIMLAAIFAPWLGTVDPTQLAPTKRYRPPSAENWFGTDALGRDVYSRVVYGARVSLIVGFSVAIISAIGGTFIGVLAGYLRTADRVLMRVMDGLMSIPPILLAIALMALTQGSVRNVVIAIAIADIPRVARLVRSTVLTLREQPFVEAAIAAGSSTPRVIWRHILPNTLAPLMVQATYLGAAAMLIESILSFIGAGVPTHVPSWGNIMAEGRSLWQVKPYIIFFPGLFLSLAVLSANLVGDGLRDWLDPRSGSRV